MEKKAIYAHIDPASVNLQLVASDQMTDTHTGEIFPTGSKEVVDRFRTLTREAICGLPGWGVDITTVREDTGNLQLLVPEEHVQSVRQYLTSLRAVNGATIWEVMAIDPQIAPAGGRSIAGSERPHHFHEAADTSSHA